MNTYQYANHTAHIDVIHGVGVLILGDDDALGRGWDEAMRELGAMGWAPLDGDDDAPMVEGYADGWREVVAIGPDAESQLHDMTIEEMERARRLLLRVLGILPTS
jgi:hypothetical protein